MTISNKLTIFRIVLVPVFVVCLMADFVCNDIIAALIFIIASLTDMLDGYLARSRNEITDFGKFADPLADKILVISALVCFVDMNIIPGWTVILILAREFVVSGLRMAAASQSVVIAADKFGKIKTVVQMIAVVLLTVEVFNVLYIPHILYYISVILTVLSGVSYVAKHKEILFK